MNEESNTIKEYFSKLPEYIQDTIISDTWNKKIADIVKRYSLTQSQSVSLQYEITFVVVGMESGGDLVSNIKNELNVSQLIAEQISKDIEKDLLSWLDNVQEANTKQEPVKVEDKEPIKIDLKSRILELGKKVINTNSINSKAEKQNIAQKIKDSLKSGNKSELSVFEKTLSKPVLDLVFDPAWKNRTEEIAKKYSLDPTQTDTLINNVLFVLIGTDKPEDFLKLMTSELGISRLLADQIIEDLEMRVFDYAIKTIEKSEQKQEVRSKNLEVEKEIVTPKQNLVIENKPEKAKVTLPVVEKPKVPEIKPVILPMVEKGEVAHNTTPQPKPTPTLPHKPTFIEKNKPVVTEEKTVSHINYKPTTPSLETVQAPIPVPRFTGIKTDNESVEVDKIPEPQKVIEPVNKIPSEPVKIPETPVEVKKVEQNTKPEPKYTVDPYREPME